MSEKEDIRSVRAIEKALGKEDNTITLSTGVVLRGKQVPPLVLVRIMASYPRPKVPTWDDPTMGRMMENPNDPDYIDQVKAWRTELANSTLNALIILGTELVKKPAKFPGPESNEWLDEYKLLGVPMDPTNVKWRYLTWITMKAAPEANDLNLIKEVVGRLSGVPEAKVEAAEDFPEGSKEPG
jgi:hypothetical protein